MAVSPLAMYSACPSYATYTAAVTAFNDAVTAHGYGSKEAREAQQAMQAPLNKCEKEYFDSAIAP